ncbi:ABC transporter ATP-binding protein [Jonquetella anthropi]|uniref:ABC transporter ATP-binding protein n=1 Tax=Jonquetella anthropi TaxID=428712 RepID=UPI0023EFDF13|nr:ABC transporter ATP-binding protein [Jonquetella anthropi]
MNDTTSPWRVELLDITKTFGGKKAVDSVTLRLAKGEVLALLGENGAGKSTLMNVLSGIYCPDGGKILLDGVVQRFRSPHDAITAGIGMVHQHFMLVESQTVWENVVLGTALPTVLPKAEIIRKVQRISETYQLAVDPTAQIWQLSVGEQQRVAILKALYQNAKVLILDEPTAVLTPQEANALFTTVSHMTAEGRSVIFISHKLDEVMAVSNRVAVLRRGQLAGVEDTAGTTKARIAELMMGRVVDLELTRTNREPGEALLELQNASASDDRGLPAFSNISLTLREGEILGLAGVSGNGQTALCQAMAGLYPLSGGRVLVDGADFTGADPRSFIDKGIRYIPADRRGVGMVGNMNAIENSALRRYRQPTAGKGFMGLRMDWHQMWKHTLSIIRNFRVDTPSEHAPVRNLSGGNLQKLMMGRELSDSHRVLLAMNPTWGLDVAASRFVREQLLAERENGRAIFLVSEDLEELLALCDHLLVIYRGQITGSIEEPTDADVERIGLMMAGESEEAHHAF